MFIFLRFFSVRKCETWAYQAFVFSADNFTDLSTWRQEWNLNKVGSFLVVSTIVAVLSSQTTRFLLLLYIFSTHSLLRYLLVFKPFSRILPPSLLQIIELFSTSTFEEKRGFGRKYDWFCWLDLAKWPRILIEI